MSAQVKVLPPAECRLLEKTSRAATEALEEHQAAMRGRKLKRLGEGVWAEITTTEGE